MIIKTKCIVVALCVHESATKERHKILSKVFVTGGLKGGNGLSVYEKDIVL